MNPAFLEKGAAESGAPILPDPDLASVITAWAFLPDAMKADILAMVRAAKGCVALRAVYGVYVYGVGKRGLTPREVRPGNWNSRYHGEPGIPAIGPPSAETT